LLEQHVTERRIRCIDPNGVHQLLDVVIHQASNGDTGPRGFQARALSGARRVPTAAAAAAKAIKNRKSFNRGGMSIAITAFEVHDD